MRTVKEVSALTGVSVRTLHYYDEIGLLRPTAVTDAGYRLYDDAAIERLRQILGFRAFDLPLSTIALILNHPELDTRTIWQSQRQMLEEKAARLHRLIEGIDGMLKGEKGMQFETMMREDMEALYDAMVGAWSPEQAMTIAARYGGMDAFRERFMESASGEAAQDVYAKVVEWYGDREAWRDAALHPLDERVMRAYGRRLEAVLAKLADRRGQDVRGFAVREAVAEYEFVLRQFLRAKSVREILRRAAKRWARGDSRLDAQYGEGTAAFFAEAFLAYVDSQA